MRRAFARLWPSPCSARRWQALGHTRRDPLQPHQLGGRERGGRVGQGLARMGRGFHRRLPETHRRFGRRRRRLRGHHELSCIGRRLCGFELLARSELCLGNEQPERDRELPSAYTPRLRTRCVGRHQRRRFYCLASAFSGTSLSTCTASSGTNPNPRCGSQNVVPLTSRTSDCGPGVKPRRGGNPWRAALRSLSPGSRSCARAASSAPRP